MISNGFPSLTAAARGGVRTLAGRLPAALLLAGLLAGALVAVAGETDLPNRKDALPGITTSGQPSAAQLAAAAEAGFTTVIDLRTPGEDRGFDEQAEVERLGLRYLSLPVAGADGVTYANAEALDALLADLDKPVLVHCSSGNRAGALLALRAKLGGADNDAALALGIAAGVTALEPVVEQRLEEGPAH
jgi:uncharacterized protein (TIGR01244 family)